MLLVRRCLALLLDMVLVLGTSYLLWEFQTVAQPDATGNDGATGCALLLLNALAYLAYFSVAESRLGYSLGEGMFNLRVVDENGRTPTLTQSLKRHILDVLEYQFFGLPALIAARITRGQRLGDLWARTRVVDARQSVRTMSAPE